MVVDDLNIMGVAVAPAKADPPLVIDSDAVLSFSIAQQALQPIAGRSPEVSKLPDV